jgi:hypothetical protein
MATKSGILATINGFITAIITQAKVRSAYSTVIDELYPTPVLDSEILETYTTKNNANRKYNIKITKQGRRVNITGSFLSVSGSAEFAPIFFTFKTNEFFPETQNVYGKAQIVSGSDVPILVSELGFKIGGSLPTGATYQFSINYNTLN